MSHVTLMSRVTPISGDADVPCDAIVPPINDTNIPYLFHISVTHMFYLYIEASRRVCEYDSSSLLLPQEITTNFSEVTPMSHVTSMSDIAPELQEEKTSDYTSTNTLVKINEMNAEAIIKKSNSIFTTIKTIKNRQIAAVV